MPWGGHEHLKVVVPSIVKSENDFVYKVTLKSEFELLNILYVTL